MILQICEKIPQVNLTKIKEWPENNLPKFEKFFKNTYTVTSPSTAYSTPRLLCHTYTNIDIHTPVISEVTNIKKVVKLELTLLNYLKEEPVLISLIFVSEFEKGTRCVLEWRIISIKHNAKIFFLLLGHLPVSWLGLFIVRKFWTSMLWEAFYVT